VPLNDPFAAYNARDVFEAKLVCRLINDDGIEAHVVEDNSMVGVSGLGLLPELHKPQVWIERTDADRVKLLLDEYEVRERKRRDRDSRPLEDNRAETIDVECSGCEQTTSFPAARRGEIEVCSHCGKYMDIDDSDEEEDEWWLGGDDASQQR